MERTSFHEIQKLNRVLIWLVSVTTVLVLGGVSMSGIYTQIIQGKPFGNNPMSDEGLIVFILITSAFAVLLIFLLKSFTLETKIDRFGISYRFLPIVRKWQIIYKEDITEWEVIKVNVLRHGMTLGVRSKTFKMKGNRFLSVTHGRKKKIRIGTQKPDEMNDAMLKLFDR